MTTEESRSDGGSLRRSVRQRAFANLVLGLLERAGRTGGRLRVRPMGPQAIVLEYRDVRTLVRDGSLFRFAARDFAVLLCCPDAWPFERMAALRMFLLAPDDAAHPNSDGRAFCVDLQGVVPARVPEIIYDNLRIRRFRLDDSVDPNAAAFVRAHSSEVPADHRPLYVQDGRSDSTGELPPLDEAGGGSDRSRRQGGLLRVVDVAVGAFDVSFGDLQVPSFLRVAHSSGTIVDAAWSLYLSSVEARLQGAKPGWVDGPGLHVDVEPDSSAVLRRELLEVGQACAALADETIALRYVGFLKERPETPSLETRAPVGCDPGTKTKGGSR